MVRHAGLHRLDLVPLLHRRWVRRLAILSAFGLVLGTLGYTLRFEAARLYLDLPPYSHDGGGETVTMLPMRDGVRLRTRVSLPDGPGPWPVVLVRNPYDVGGSFRFVCGIFVRNGYGCVHQDVRGRMGSEGEWVPMAHERNDGLDTLHWLVEQDFVDGNIALYGMSYLASVQWAVVDAVPPEVKTMIPMVYGTDGYGVQYEGGLFKHEVISAWAALMPAEDMRFDNGDAYHAMTRHRPAREADEVHLGARIDWYRDWIESDTRGGTFWSLDEVRFMRQQPERTHIPVLEIGGWFDLFLSAQFDDFSRLPRRDESRFVIGPWHHLQRSDLSLPNDPGLAGQWAETFDWLDHHLRGAPYPREKGVIVTYAMGEGAWHTRPDFPPPTEQVTLHLSGFEAAAGCEGGLLETSSTAAGQATYRYDPDDPVPSEGGSALLAFAFGTFDGVSPGPVEQSQHCLRPDVLTFRTAALQEELHIAGRMAAELEVSSSAPDTAFTVKVLEERPDGSSVNIREGARTLAHRLGDATRIPYEPGARVSLEIELWPIEWVLPAGHRLRLEVSSSNFPALHAHTNRFGPWASQTGADVAQNTLHAGSRLQVPACKERTRGSAVPR